MQSHFSADFFQGNRARLQALIGDSAPIILTGNGVMQRGGDEPSPFHQDSSFWYLTGLDGADLTLVITSSETFIIVPTLSAVREAFDGAHDPEAYRQRSGIDSFLPEREGWQRIRAALQGRNVATLASPPPHLRSHGIHTLPFRRRLVERLKRQQAGLKIRDIRPELAAMRSVKQPAELKALQRAIDITTDTLSDIAKNALKQAKNEYELDAALGYGFRLRGAPGMPSPPSPPPAATPPRCTIWRIADPSRRTTSSCSMSVPKPSTTPPISAARFRSSPFPAAMPRCSRQSKPCRITRSAHQTRHAVPRLRNRY